MIVCIIITWIIKSFRYFFLFVLYSDEFSLQIMTPSPFQTVELKTGLSQDQAGFYGSTHH